MGVLGLGRENHFSEFNDPLVANEGTLSPQVRKARAIANLGMSAGIGGAVVYRQLQAPATATDTATLTAAQVLTGNIIGTPTAAANYTLPTVANIEATLTDMAVGDAFEFRIWNAATTATFDITVLTATGWTLSGSMVVGAGPNDGTEHKGGTFLARKTGAGAYTLFRVG